MTPDKPAPSERDNQIQLALRHIKYKLKVRGDDPTKYNQKYLLDKATKVIDDWMKENPNERGPYRPLIGQKL